MEIKLPKNFKKKVLSHNDENKFIISIDKTDYETKNRPVEYLIDRKLFIDEKINFTELSKEVYEEMLNLFKYHELLLIHSIYLTPKLIDPEKSKQYQQIKIRGYFN